MSQITTHILDTTRGLPAVGVVISLQYLMADQEWKEIASGVTNFDGRVSDFLDEHISVAHGTYRLVFHTREYFYGLHVNAFYPYVTVVFEINDQAHYHVPLLLNPYGYSTYRGS
jgi:5-hydroxyisourate hydrolase